MEVNINAEQIAHMLVGRFDLVDSVFGYQGAKLLLRSWEGLWITESKGAYVRRWCVSRQTQHASSSEWGGGGAADSLAGRTAEPRSSNITSHGLSWRFVIKTAAIAGRNLGS
jgi:hypothetical protein